MSGVRVYTTNYCAYCVAAKAHLSRAGVDFDAIDVSHDGAKRDWLVATTGMRTVPQIFVGETSIGGYTDMMALVKNGEFNVLLDREGIAHK